MKRKIDKFVKVPLWWAEQAVVATGTKKAFVWIWLLYLAWNSNTVTVPNWKLEACGIDRCTKYRALRELEAAGLIQVERPKRKSPIVTLLYM